MARFAARLATLCARSSRITLLLALVVILVSSAQAHMPSQEAIQRYKDLGMWDQKLEQLIQFHTHNEEMLAERDHNVLKAFAERMASLADDEVDTSHAIVILVEFPDYKHDDLTYSIPGQGTVLSSPYVGEVENFDSLLFTRQGIDPQYNPTGSMTEFYLENSYNKHLIIGDVAGWFEVDSNYSFYVGNDDGLLNGSRLAYDAIRAANPYVDFSDYVVPGYPSAGVIVVHAGPGAESQRYGVWSHRSSITQSLIVDGVVISDYSMNPEESGGNSIASVGVFCHEWGHIMGLPDLYDIIYNPGSNGLGEYSVMAGGSWNLGGRKPAQFDAYSKFRLGFVSPIRLEENLPNAPIPQIETDPVIYMLRPHPDSLTAPNREFWLVENRQQVGFDEEIPAEGLFIYHVDTWVSQQNNPDRYMVAVEEADGDTALAYGGSSGSPGDAFPGTSDNRAFHSFSLPDSRMNVGDSITQVGVWDISDSDSLMYADLDVEFSRPWPILWGDSLVVTDEAPGGDGDGLFEQGETISIEIEVLNQMKQTFHPTASVSFNRPGLQVLNQDVDMGVAMNRVESNTLDEPIQVYIPDDFISSDVDMTVMITTDRDFFPGGDRSYTSTFDVRIPIGQTSTLLVDDDQGRSYQIQYQNSLDNLGIRHDTWTKLSAGSPTAADLLQYSMVIWLTGSRTGGGELNTDDIAALKSFLDAGGRFILMSDDVIEGLHATDSAFLADYLHANRGDQISSRVFRGLAGHSLGGNLLYQATSSAYRNTLTAVNGGEDAFVFTNTDGSVENGVCGVAYDGVYKTVLLTVGLEYVSSTSDDYSPRDSLLNRAIDFCFLGNTTDVPGGEAEDLMPGGFALHQNYPNPFNPSTVISYSIAPGDFEKTELSIYNLLGRRVVTLVDEPQGPGDYQVVWDGHDSQGQQAATGVYFYRLTRGDQTSTRKMMLVK